MKDCRTLSFEREVRDNGYISSTDFGVSLSFVCIRLRIGVRPSTKPLPLRRVAQ